MPTPATLTLQRAFSGTRRRIFQLLTEMGTSGDAIWPSATQPFMRSSGPLTPGKTEEWHCGVHAVLAEVADEERIVWRFDVPGIDGTYGFYLTTENAKTVVTQKVDVTLAEGDGRNFWRRFEEVNAMMIEGMFDKLARVLKR